MKRYLLLGSLLGVVALFTPLVHADTILDTTGSSVLGDGSVRSNVWDAFSFQTGGTGTTLNSIVLDINSSDAQTVSLLPNLTLNIYAANGSSGGPGTLLQSYGFDWNVGDAATFGSISSSLNLSSSTVYWLGITSNSANTEYFLTNSPVTTGMSGYAFTTTNNYAGGGSGSWSSPFTYSLTPMVALKTDAVPEPATLFALGVGLLALVFVKKIRRTTS